MKNGLETIYSRRCIRKYRDEQISDAELEQILKAGTCAASAKNCQSAIIVALQNKEEIKYLSKLNAKFTDNPDKDPFYGAPTVAVVLADRDAACAVQDGSLVMGNLMNAAAALDIGSCWINRAKEVFETEEGKALLKKWGIEGNYLGIGNCILGYKAEEPEMKPRKENYVYYVR